MVIGRKIYWDKVTGNVIVDTGQRSGSVRETTQEEDFATYKELAERVPEMVGMIQLEYGQYEQDFAQASGYRVNPQTKQLEFSYPDPNAPDPEHPAFQKPLSEQVRELQEENTLLKAQNTALSDRADFIEDVIAEMAQQVYQ